MCLYIIINNIMYIKPISKYTIDNTNTNTRINTYKGPK